MKNAVLIAMVLAAAITTIIVSVQGEPAYIEALYQVERGDTLWDIGQNYSQGDIRKWVYDVKQLNGGQAVIYPGQAITILVPESRSTHMAKY